MKAPASRSSSPRGFSLIEVMVVLAIIVTVAFLAVPAVRQMMGGRGLTATGSAIANNLQLARQSALLQNRPIEVRFYFLPGPDGEGGRHYRAFQLFRIEDTGAVPTTRILFFSKSIILTESPSTTSLLSLPGQPLDGATTGVKLPGVGVGYQYLSFRFRPSGDTNLDITQKWFLTVVSENAPTVVEGLPADFLTIQLDPTSGKAVTLRP
ncbi:Verru_Chthon cassette protein D [Verrucomicrobium sp. GAS474]|uniref:Verru_Chthon cassette protein D n=1 Tax=Verrucomicrobium sp. GAS474 TaxID=1882831 RepID=UPI00087B3680|nr:Verru_Chthon cassette protein D [Verrucomicrobium sp. GAS474]SDT89133.1 Verru_Chthon cassette protein D [Verrucomicrobium sp. GAS474]